MNLISVNESRICEGMMRPLNETCTKMIAPLDNTLFSLEIIRIAIPAIVLVGAVVVGAARIVRKKIHASHRQNPEQGHPPHPPKYCNWTIILISVALGGLILSGIATAVTIVVLRDTLKNNPCNALASSGEKACVTAVKTVFDSINLSIPRNATPTTPPQ